MQCTHIFARLAPISYAQSVLIYKKKNLHRMSVGSLLKVRCWLRLCFHSAQQKWGKMGEKKLKEKENISFVSSSLLLLAQRNCSGERRIVAVNYRSAVKKRRRASINTLSLSLSNPPAISEILQPPLLFTPASRPISTYLPSALKFLFAGLQISASNVPG